jgi:MATE family multidrug resistance protein
VGLLVIVFRSQIINFYTNDAGIADIAHRLIVFTAIYHMADALQVVITFALRGYKRAVVPTLIYVTALWGVGLGVGYMLTFRGLALFGFFPNSPLGPAGFWIAAIISVILVVLLQFGYFHFVSKSAITAQKNAN